MNIWSEIGEIKPTQVKAIKSFSINYAKNSYRGVLEYGFSQYDSQTDEHKFANETYRKVFRNVKDTIEYQLPRIISLFESLIIRAFEIKKLQLSKPIDLSNIIRFFEIGATSPLGVDMVEKAIPIVTVKKIDRIRFNTAELEGQRKEFEKLFMQIANQFDQYEKYYLIDYIKKNREMVLLPGPESIPKQLTNLMEGLYPIKRFLKEYCTRESKKMQEEKTQKLEQAMKVCKAEDKPVESAKPKTREERVRDIEVAFTLCDQFLNDCLLAQEKGADFNSSKKTLERVVDRLFNDKKFNPFDHFEKNKSICVKTEEGFYKLKPNTPEKVLKTFEDKFKDARHELDIVTEKFYELNVPKILAERE